jgi:hypothetical protein
MAGRKISEKSKEIVRLLESGMSWFEVYKLGYSRMTCKYYYWKLKKPKQFKSFVSQIIVCNNNAIKEKKVNNKKDIKL